MAHEITIREDGKAEMAFRAGTEFPWHFQDTNPAQVPADATTDEWVRAAGMEWTVEASTVRYIAKGNLLPFDGRVVLHRSDTLAPLGDVSDGYCILQPREVLAFFEDIVQTVGLRLDTAGTLFGGRRFWALASVGEDCLLHGLDKHKGYLLLSTSADGTRATEGRFTDVRVVCNNTITMSDRYDSAGQIKISHRTQWNPDDVKRRLGVAPATFAEFMANMRKLADYRMTDDAAQFEVKKLFKVKDEAEQKREHRAFTRTMDLFRGMATGSDLPGVQGTAYGLLNAVTEAVDHKSRAKSDSHRFDRAMMGSGEQIKGQFRDQLLELVA